MKKLAVLVLLAGMAACTNNKKPEEGREPAQTGAPTVVGSAVGPSAAAGGGTASAPGSAVSAGAASGAQGAPAPSGAGNVGCAQPTTLACGDGQVDGCTGGLTAVHVCVAKDAKAGPPCAQELALSCPAGQGDACLHNPPQAPTHLCVVAPKP